MPPYPTRGVVLPSATLLTVTGSAPLTEHLVRVRFSGDLAAFADSTATDRYVKLVFPRPGVTYPEPFDLREVRAAVAPEDQPVVRTYTVRELDVAAGTLAIDFVVHGDEGVAGPWAASVAVGTPLWVNGPGGAYAPDPMADFHLLVADESALPALAAAVEALPADARGLALVEVAGPGDELPLAVPAGVELRWLHRGTTAHEAPPHLTGAGSPLAVAVAELDAGAWPTGRVQAFVHGEAEAVMHHVRPVLRRRGVGKRDLSVSGYWRRGRTEEGFRTWKAELACAEGA